MRPLGQTLFQNGFIRPLNRVKHKHIKTGLLKNGWETTFLIFWRWRLTVWQTGITIIANFRGYGLVNKAPKFSFVKPNTNEYSEQLSYRGVDYRRTVFSIFWQWPLAVCQPDIKIIAFFKSIFLVKMTPKYWFLTAINNWPNRFKVCAKAKGGHFQKLIFLALSYNYRFNLLDIKLNCQILFIWHHNLCVTLYSVELRIYDIKLVNKYYQ